MRTESIRYVPLVATAGAIVLVMLSIAFGPIAYASTPIQVTGTWTYTITSMQVTHTADGNTFLSVTFSETLRGTISGTRVGTGMFVIHPDGRFNAIDRGTFTGTIAGSAIGTSTNIAKGSGTFASGTSSGTFVITDGAAGLAGVHGVIHWVGDPNGNTYSGQVNFSS